MHVTNLSMHIRGEHSQVFNGEDACFDQLVVLLSQRIHKLGSLCDSVKFTLGCFQTGLEKQRTKMQI